MTKASGQFIVRASAPLHARLKADAQKLGVALNELCVQRLSVPSSVEGAAGDDLRAALALADATFRARLRGLIVYGSVARDQARPTSDLDVLIVLDDSVAIERSLYGLWDAAAKDILAHRVEASFAHLPAPEGKPTGFWAEIALDGIILFDRGLVVSRYCGAVRRAISDGVIVRRVVHGQAYWITGEVA